MDLSKVTVTAEPGIDIAVVTASKAFTDWVAAVDADRFVVSAVHIQSVDMFGPKVGFIKFKASVTDSAGKFIPGIVFMRGGCVAMLVVLTCKGKKYTVITVQPRIPSGRFDFVEIPAGMLDGSGNFAGVAAKELDEELGLKIDSNDLIDLSERAGHTKGFFVSPGGTDETIRVFAYEKEVTE
jgi:ADP-sugar diphosphatase